MIFIIFLLYFLLFGTHWDTCWLLISAITCFIGDRYTLFELIIVINYSNINLDRDFLQHVGDMDCNSFINILQTNTETGEDENYNQPEIISHSPCYEVDKLISTLTSRKNEFSTFSRIYCQ